MNPFAIAVGSRLSSVSFQLIFAFPSDVNCTPISLTGSGCTAYGTPYLLLRYLSIPLYTALLTVNLNVGSRPYFMSAKFWCERSSRSIAGAEGVRDSLYDLSHMHLLLQRLSYSMRRSLTIWLCIRSVYSLLLILLSPPGSVVFPSDFKVYIARVPTIESFCVMPASEWNPNERSTGIPRPFSFDGFIDEPLLIHSTQSPRDMKSSL